MQFDHGGVKHAGGVQDVGLRFDEEGNTDPGLREVLDRLAQLGPCAKDIEAALRGSLVAVLWDEAHRMRARAEGQARPSGVAAISILRGTNSWRRSRSMSSSRMWRRSSRRCAVMPSAPARTARWAARIGSGSGPAAGVPDGRDMVDVELAEARPGNCHESVLAQAMPLSSHPRAVRNFLMRRVAV